jgi:hypothetical protein
MLVGPDTMPPLPLARGPAAQAGGCASTVGTIRTAFSAFAAATRKRCLARAVVGAARQPLVGPEVLRGVKGRSGILRSHEDRVFVHRLVEQQVQVFLQPRRLAGVFALLHPQVAQVLVFKQANFRVAHFVVPVLALRFVHAALGLGRQHAEVKLIGVALEHFLLQVFDLPNFALEVARALNVVLLLLQQPQVLPLSGLRALLVRFARDGIP